LFFNKFSHTDNLPLSGHRLLAASILLLCLLSEFPVVEGAKVASGVVHVSLSSVSSSIVNVAAGTLGLDKGQGEGEEDDGFHDDRK